MALPRGQVPMMAALLLLCFGAVMWLHYHHVSRAQCCKTPQLHARQHGCGSGNLRCGCASSSMLDGG
jgi:hypothetical protein